MPDIQLMRGTVPVDSLTLVSADQVTVFGDGSAERPLTTIGGALGTGITIDATRQASGLFVPGRAVYQTALADRIALAQGDDIDTSYVVGLQISDDESGGSALFFPCKYRNSGTVVLTTAQWDAVTGDSGGLVANAQYWLSDTVAGKISTVKPSTGGNYATLVGIALNATTLLLQIMAPIAL